MPRMPFGPDLDVFEQLGTDILKEMKVLHTELKNLQKSSNDLKVSIDNLNKTLTQNKKK